MPLTELSFETNHCLNTHEILISILKKSGYQILVNMPYMIKGKRKLSLTKYPHTIEVLFSFPLLAQGNTEQATVTLKINHWASKNYLKDIGRKLINSFPGINAKWVTHEHTKDHKHKAKYPERRPITHSTEKKETWQCWNCGSENDGDALICIVCGVDREAQYNAVYAGAGANDFGYDPLLDDDQGLM